MTIKNRYEFVYLFDVKDGNPNGDPDAGNYPRIDAETGHGLVTDVCLKRKIRNYVTIVKQEQPSYDIFIKEKSILNDQIARAKKIAGKQVSDGRNWMCGNFYDVRTFGAVMTTGENCGQVRGPVQLTFSRSIDPIVTCEHTITRMAVTTEKEAEKQEGDNRTMGRKHTVPYGLYKAHGFISAHLAEQVGFNEADLDLFWEALKNMFDHDHSAARGLMSARGLYVFKHESHLGNVPAHTLFDKISIRKKEGVMTPRQFTDYEIKIDENSMPKNVSLIKML